MLWRGAFYVNNYLRLYLGRVAVFFKKVVWSTFENITERLKVIKLDACGLVVYDTVKILIA